MEPSLELAEFCGVEHPRLVGLLSLYCGERDLAEELAQEAIARVCGQWNSVRRKDSPSAWVHRVALNLANSHFRRRAVARLVAARIAGERAREVEDQIAAMAVRSAVAALPRREREALVLRFFADFTVAEVAAVMACPEGTVKTLTRRGIERLRRSGLVDTDEVELEEVSDAD